MPRRELNQEAPGMLFVPFARATAYLEMPF